MTSRRKGTRSTAELRSRLTSDVLTALRTTTQFLPSSLRAQSPGKDLQLFEVLTAYIMSLVESDFHWTVTPLQHDGGVDFYGEKRLFPMRGYEDYKVVIAGQCKVSKSVRRPLTNDLWRLLDTIQPAVVYIFLTTPFTEERIKREQELFRTQTHRQCRIFDLHSVVDLLGIHREEILRLIHQSLNAPTEGILRNFIADLPESTPQVDATVRAPDRVLTGKPFKISVSFSSLLIGAKKILVHWRHSQDLTLIKPAALRGEADFYLEPNDAFTSDLTLKCVTYQVGEVSLGELIVETDGTTKKRFLLGSATSIDQYHPVFFWEPYHTQRIRLLEKLEEASARSPQAIAVTGQGGAGKTRFCCELGYLAEQRDAEFISVAHPKDLSHPYRLLALLLGELLTSSLDPVDPRSVVDAFLREIHPTLHKEAQGTLDVVFSTAREDSGRFDRDLMLQIILVVLLRKARSVPYVLHLSDLHWASIQTLEIVGDLLVRLKALGSEYTISVLLVLEGRVQTHLDFSKDAEARTRTQSTAIFERFLRRFSIEQLLMPPLSEAQSKAFLLHLFENSQSASRRISLELIPHQEMLMEEIRRYGQGNPFHIIEQVRLLRHKGVVARNGLTGLIYLERRPARFYNAPVSVHELIVLRLEFLAHKRPEIAVLVKAVGLIKDRIPIGLFEILRQDLAASTPAAEIQNLEILNFESLTHIGFRHENYYQVVRNWSLDSVDRKKVCAVYLDWYKQLGRRTPDVAYEEALIRCSVPGANRSLIKRLLAAALSQAEASHQYQLAIQIIEKIMELQLPVGDSSVRSSDILINSLRLRAKLANFSIEVNDWELGGRQHEAIVEEIDNCLGRSPPPDAAGRSTLARLRAASLVELANTKSDLGRAHESIRHLTVARKICESYLATERRVPQEEDEQWRILYVRCLNRLGEANWMDGNYSAAISALEAATTAVEEHVVDPEQKRLLRHINLLDYGAVLLHQAPRRAVKTLRESRALVPADGWPPHYGILANITLVIGEAVELFLRQPDSSKQFLSFLRQRAVPEVEENLDCARFYGLKQEQVAASLMLGVFCSLLNEDGAANWYMESIETAFRSNNLESLWRGHLNLAQWLELRDENSGASFHCYQAARILSDDLLGRKKGEREWRERHLMHPLRRIAAMLPRAELARISDYPSAALCPTPESVRSLTNREERSMFFADRIVFFEWGQSEYYPYGG